MEDTKPGFSLVTSILKIHTMQCWKTIYPIHPLLLAERKLNRFYACQHMVSGPKQLTHVVMCLIQMVLAAISFCQFCIIIACSTYSPASRMLRCAIFNIKCYWNFRPTVTITRGNIINRDKITIFVTTSRVCYGYFYLNRIAILTDRFIIRVDNRIAFITIK